MANNPLNVKDANVSRLVTDTNTLLTNIQTAVQIIDNFISGTKGLVTEDNSLAIKTAVEVIDNFISGNRGLVTEDNSLSIKNNTLDTKTATEKIAKEEIDDDDITKAQTKNAQIILLYYFDTNADTWKRVDESLFQSGGLSIDGTGNIGLDVGGVATALGGIAVGGIAAGASVLLDSGGNPVHQKSFVENNNIPVGFTLPTIINLPYVYDVVNDKWIRVSGTITGDLKVQSQNIEDVLGLINSKSDDIRTAVQIIDNFISGSRGLVTEDNSLAIKNAVQIMDDWDNADRGKVIEEYDMLYLSYTKAQLANGGNHDFVNGVIDADEDIYISDIFFDYADIADFNNISTEGFLVDFFTDGTTRMRDIHKPKPLLFSSVYYASYHIKLSKAFKLDKNTALRVNVINASGNSIDTLNCKINYYKI